MRQPLAVVLAQARGLLVEPRFDPAAEHRVLRLAMTDIQAELLLAPLVRLVAAQAPGVVLEWVPIGPGLSDRVRAGEIDLALALDTSPLPRGTKSEPLMDDRLSVVMRQDHPSGGIWRLADYARYPSVVITLLGDSASELDAELAAQGVSRAIAAIVPTFRAAAEIVAQTYAVTTISHAFARKLAPVLHLALAEPPLRNTRLGVVTVWADHRSQDPVLVWLRQVLQRVAATGACAQTSGA